MEKTTIISSFILGSLIALGLTFGGYHVGQGFIKSKITQRFISVKGLSERVIMADFVNWGMSIQAAGPKLESAVQKLEESKTKLITFLTENGFDSNEVENDRFKAEDTFSYMQFNSQPTEQMLNSRYRLSQVMIVRTKDVMKVYHAYQKLTELLKEGVMIDSTNQYYSSGPIYNLTFFNDIKGDMLTEAVSNARKSAEIFAQDSNSKLGKLKSANQGVFTISALEGNDAMNEPGSLRKKVRALITQEYYLDD